MELLLEKLEAKQTGIFWAHSPAVKKDSTDAGD
jgi:hypothetical protein